jgi:hypothetical protein
MTAPADGSGVLWDIAMADVAAATMDDTARQPAPAARRAGAGWVLDAPSGPVPVEEPRSRKASGVAPPSGADTVRVFSSLGIPTP